MPNQTLLDILVSSRLGSIITLALSIVYLIIICQAFFCIFFIFFLKICFIDNACYISILSIFLRVTKHVFPFNSARYFAFNLSGLNLSVLAGFGGNFHMTVVSMTNHNIKNILVIQGDELLVIKFFYNFRRVAFTHHKIDIIKLLVPRWIFCFFKLQCPITLQCICIGSDDE